MHKYYNYGLLIFAMVLLVGCSTGSRQVAMDSSANPAVEINNQQLRLNEARNQQVDLLAPQQFKESLEMWEEAKDSLEKKPEKALTEIGRSRAYLTKAEQSAASSRVQFEGVLTARADVINAKANVVMPKEFSKADHDFKILGRKAEDGRLGQNVNELMELRADYVRAEVKAIKKVKLGETYALIHKARDRGAKRITPMTYQMAQIALVNAEQVIDSEKNNTARIDEAAKKAYTEAEKLTMVLSYAKSAGGREAERLATQMYTQKLQDQKLNEKLRTQTLEEKQTLKALRAATQENADLKTKTEMQARIDELRKEFKPTEAEVLQEGDQVIFRLKAIQFGSATADIPSQSLATLTKVKNAVNELNPEKVIVQGHTDSTGGESLNKKVSEDRALTIKEYLITSDIPEEKIETEGLGFSKPLATNKTKQGRAQNRRVDIIVFPGAEIVGEQL